MKYDVSILVPVYNVERFIERCLHSLFSQTYHNIEFIFIDDCSPDNSIDLIQKVLINFPKRKEHVKIIRHEKNLGLAAARKTALMASSGTYILNADSDDYLDTRAVEKFYDKAVEEDADIVVCDFWMSWRKTKKYFPQNFSTDKDTFINMLLSAQTMPGVVNKLFKRTLYFDNNVFPIENINLGEDLITTPRLVYYANKIAKIDEGLVYYVQYNMGSYTKTMSDKNVQDLTFVLNYLQQFFYNKKEKDVYKDALLRGQLHKKIRMIIDAHRSKRAVLFQLFPNADKQQYVQQLPLIERIVFSLYKERRFFLLNVCIAVYRSNMEIVQIFKGRRL